MKITVTLTPLGSTGLFYFPARHIAALKAWNGDRTRANEASIASFSDLATIDYTENYHFPGSGERRFDGIRPIFKQQKVLVEIDRHNMNLWVSQDEDRECVIGFPFDGRYTANEVLLGTAPEHLHDVDISALLAKGVRIGVNKAGHVLLLTRTAQNPGLPSGFYNLGINTDSSTTRHHEWRKPVPGEAYDGEAGVSVPLSELGDCGLEFRDTRMRDIEHVLISKATIIDSALAQRFCPALRPLPTGITVAFVRQCDNTLGFCVSASDIAAIRLDRRAEVFINPETERILVRTFVTRPNEIALTISPQPGRLAIVAMHNGRKLGILNETDQGLALPKSRCARRPGVERLDQFTLFLVSRTGEYTKADGVHVRSDHVVALPPSVSADETRRARESLLSRYRALTGAANISNGITEEMISESEGNQIALASGRIALAVDIAANPPAWLRQLNDLVPELGKLVLDAITIIDPVMQERYAPVYVNSAEALANPMALSAILGAYPKACSRPQSMNAYIELLKSSLATVDPQNHALHDLPQPSDTQPSG